MSIKARPLVDRFWEKVDIRDPDDCWEWMAAKNQRGYGLIRVGGAGSKMSPASRVAWELHNRMDVGDLQVCHSCDNPGCCNPNHLHLGTGSDNMQECVARGRDPKVKLSERQVVEIRFRLQNRKRGDISSVAREYGVHVGTIQAIVDMRSWRYL